MTSQEKFYNMLNIVKPKDRSEIPIFPMIITWCGTASGHTQTQILSSQKTWIESMDKTFDLIGDPDVFMSNWPTDIIFVMGLPSRIPGRELGDNELYQFVETPYITDEDYKKILTKGWSKWYNSYLMEIQKPKMIKEYQLILRFIKLGMHAGKNIKHFTKRGQVPIYHSATGPIFDTLSMVRSMQEFIFDLVDDPGPIMDIINSGTPDQTALTIKNVKRAKGDRVGIYAMRSSATFVSPEMFKEYVWPSLKQSIEEYWRAGIVSILHADGNWLPMLPFFKELPKGSVHFELDGATDIFKAHESLGGWHSIRGDVPATMLALGTPDEVSKYCEKLITELGMKGGFMLGSGCEVPLNAKLENVKAMMDSLKR